MTVIEWIEARTLIAGTRFKPGKFELRKAAASHRA
ncbi:hypothetical protein FHU14_004751 [Mesorhizobium sp. RMAD-H1]|nr:hypothetical protein [Mesorhizobium sp. RMAD-H1]